MQDLEGISQELVNETEQVQKNEEESLCFTWQKRMEKYTYL
ncbi:hypothetical protein CAL7102_08279 [Dulcicalothrix desertica PCC 7102]|nr:hypothetical protein CAL7102_08279 [Dulcicalothrix desertica PCC 7102]